MSNQLRTRDGLPYDFEDGLKIKGKNLASLDGAAQIGCKLNLTDVSETILQSFLYTVKTYLDNPTAPNRVISTNDTTVANTAFVQALITALINNAPSNLNTLSELAAALNNDPNYYQSVATAIADKLTVTDYQRGTAIVSTAGATADSITATFTPAITQLYNGMILFVRSSGPNTSIAPTFTPNNGNIAFTTIVKAGGLPLQIGDIPSAGYWMELQYDLATNRWALKNPATGIAQVFASGAEALGGVVSNKAVTPLSLKSVIDSLINSAPGTLDTLNEIAAALGNDPNFVTTMTNVLATKAPINNPTFTGTVGGITKDMVGLPNVDNTSDMNKPVSTAQASLIALKAPLASPALTGLPTTPTALTTDNSLQIANTAFVKAVVAALVNSSPATLDTLNEIATALGNDPNFATTMTTALGNKQPLDATLTALAAIVTATDKLIYATGVDTFATTTLTSYIRTLLAATDNATAQTALGIIAATTAAVGISRLATTTEATTGTATNIAVTPAGLKTVADTKMNNAQATATNLATTPAVTGLRTLALSNTSATSITQFTGAGAFQEVILFSTTTFNRLVDNSNIVLKGGLNRTLAINEVVYLVFNSNGSIAFEI